MCLLSNESIVLVQTQFAVGGDFFIPCGKYGNMAHETVNDTETDTAFGALHML